MIFIALEVPEICARVHDCVSEPVFCNNVSSRVLTTPLTRHFYSETLFVLRRVPGFRGDFLLVRVWTVFET